MGTYLTRTLRGALAGMAAAGVWALEQPLDKRVLAFGYDDTMLLGRWVTRGRAAAAAGVAMHLANGALMGALYTRVAARLPVPEHLRGPAFALTEHLATWPGTALLPRLHPAAAELPPLWGSARAFAQATWRHLLFGAVLGELERAFNRRSAAPGIVDPAAAASNGHGSSEHLVMSGPA